MIQSVDKMTKYHSIGKNARRQDAPDKLRGRARYAGDITVPGLLHGRLVLSPYSHASIITIDTSAALMVPGVKAVYTSETLDAMKCDSSSRTWSPLARKEVLWAGHPVAIVLAESEAAAADGAAVVNIDYKLLPAVIDPVVAMQPGAPLVDLQAQDEDSRIASGNHGIQIQQKWENQEDLSRNVTRQTHFHCGDIEASWSEAEVIAERTYRTSFVHQSYLEPQSITAVPGRSRHQITLWPSSQSLFAIRSVIAESLHMPEGQVLIEPVPIGGSFGGKEGLAELMAAAAAFTSRSPVRLVYTRSEDLLAGNPAPGSVITLRLGAKRDGTLVAMQAKVIFDIGAYAVSDVCLGGYFLGSVYNCPNVNIRRYEVRTNKVGVGAYRAPGGPQANFALEATIDELCWMLEMDPIAFRLKNALSEGIPTLDDSSSRGPHIRFGLVECLEKAQEHPLWMEKERQSVAPPELSDWRIGIGVAVGAWPSCTESTAAACRLETDGSISVIIGRVDLTGSDTSLALIAAEELGVPAASVKVIHSNTDTALYSGSAGGSKAISSVGPAILAAARNARKQILAIATDLLEVAVADLEVDRNKIVVRGDTSKSLELATIASASLISGGKYKPVYGHGSAVSRISSPMFAVHMVKIAVDPETGEVRVLDYVAVQDVGFAINPAEVEGQICGGVVQGFGWALFEGFLYDAYGQLLTSTLMDYALPRAEDVPKITPVLVENSSGLGPFGSKGVGEMPVIPVGAAIANAIADAVGIRLTQLPITHARLFAKMQAHSQLLKEA